MKASNSIRDPDKRFSAIVQAAMEAWTVPGLAVAVVQHGEVIFLEGFGQRNVEHDFKVTPETLFALASGTKAFTTMALGLLVDEGKLDWDLPVRHYLPDFQLYDTYATERLTPRDLVTHRSGLPRHDASWYNSPFSRKELVRRLRYLEPNSDLRAAWQYQNLMYMTAGHLLEHVTGAAWEEFVQQRIFQPLGMHNSNLSVKVSQAAADHARPYKRKDEQLHEQPFYSQWAVGPAGSINTTVADMSKWLMLHLNHGLHHQQPFISSAQLRDMHMPHMVVRRPTKYAELPHQSYGLGWFIEPYRGHNLVHHGGNINGFSTMTTIMPQDNLGVVVLSNLNATPAPWIICLNLYDQLLGLDPIDWTARFKQDEVAIKAAGEQGKRTNAAVQVANTRPWHALESYIGDYEHPGYGLLSFTLNDGALQAHLNGNQYPVKHYHYDTFELTWEQWDLRIKATFTTNARGDIVAVAAPFEQTVSDIIFNRLPNQMMSSGVFLSQFVGDYDLLGVPITIMLRNDSTLMARLPGQPDLELVPRRDAEFLVKNRSAYSIEFTKGENGEVVAAIVTQPVGTFTAKKR